MSKRQITIAIDAMGGDNAPSKNIEGLKIFLEKNRNKEDFSFLLFGKEKILKDLLIKHSVSEDKIEIINV